MGVRNNLVELRLQRGVTVAQLAASIGVSRQTVYAMEAGTYVPNTLVALKLSRALSVGVEDLFWLESDAPMPIHTEDVEILSTDAGIQPGQPLRLCKVGGKLIGVFPEPGTWSLPLADAVVMESSTAKRNGKVRAQILGEGLKIDKRLLISGCDPGGAILGRHLQRQGIDLVVAYQNSSRSLELLKQGVVHVAGCHIRDEKTGESNLPVIKKLFGKESVGVFSFALWEEGILVARGNPKGIHSIADFTRPDVRITNREPGAGSRLLLDSYLHQLGIDGATINGYDQIAYGQLPAARHVLIGESDCCINTKPTSRVLGMDFIPLVTKRYDLVVRKNHLKLPQVQALFETLGRTAFRRELEVLGEYDMKTAGDRLI
jgi:putative molybdopterin biosynthesis protein